MNKVKTIAVAICMFAVVVIGVYGWYDSHTEKTYGVDATVTAIANDEVYVVDSEGMAYSFYGDDYQVRDSIRLIMSNNRTPDRHDDVVTGAVTR